MSTTVARGGHRTKTSASSTRSLTFCVSVALSLFSGNGGNRDGTSGAQAVAEITNLHSCLNRRCLTAMLSAVMSLLHSAVKKDLHPPS